MDDHVAAVMFADFPSEIEGVGEHIDKYQLRQWIVGVAHMAGWQYVAIDNLRGRFESGGDEILITVEGDGIRLTYAADGWVEFLSTEY